MDLSSPSSFSQSIHLRTCLVFILSCVQNSVDRVVGCLGPVLAMLAITLIVIVVYCYFTVVLPTYELGMATGGQVVLGLALLFNILWNYFMCMIRGPGFVPELMDKFILEQLVFDPDLNTRNGRRMRECLKCERVKPMRAHHCSICKKCVLKMDHRMIRLILNSMQTVHG